MMKKFNQHFTMYFVLSLLFLSILVIGQNIIRDPFSVFVKTTPEAIKNKQIFPNERFLKMKYILANLDKYDSFLIGSCSCNFMNLDKIPNEKWYNITFTNNTIFEMNRSLKILLAHDAKIKHVLVQISEASLKGQSDDYLKMCKHFLNYCAYPETTKEKMQFYGRYLYYFPLIDAAKYDPWFEGSRRNIFKGGSFLDDLPKDKSEMFETHKEMFNTNLGVDDKPYNPENIRLIKEMIDLCKANNIKFDMFFIPEYVGIYQTIDLKAFNDIKRTLASYTPYYDFTGINEISGNIEYFIDPIHINNWATKLIIERIFYQDKNKAPFIKGYGVYVTEKNIDKHIKNLENEMTEYNTNSQKQ